MPNAMQAFIAAYAVAVIAKEEDELLNASGPEQSMPNEWTFGDVPLSRWKEVGIEVPDLFFAK